MARPNAEAIRDGVPTIKATRLPIREANAQPRARSGSGNYFLVIALLIVVFGIAWLFVSR